MASPTVAIDSLMATMVIDACKGRDSAIFDVTGAYLHADMPEDKKILLKLSGRFVDIMCDVYEEHRKNAVYENGKKVLYLWVVKVLYGCIQSALLWYQLYVETLMKYGFELNPYDKCVANKVINAKQCTITWYVDDNNISHVDEKVVTEMFKILKGHFGELTIT